MLSGNILPLRLLTFKSSQQTDAAIDKGKPPYTEQNKHLLIQAFQTDDETLLEELLAQGLPLDIRIDVQWPLEGVMWQDLTLLHLACQEGCTRTVQLLIGRGASVGARTLSGMNPLHYASKSGNCATVTSLLDSGLSLDEREQGGLNALHVASSNGRASVAALLIDRGANVHSQTAEDWTPLHFASETGHVASVQLLIRHGADLNAKTANGRTPIHYASQSGQLEVVRLLIELKARIEEKDSMTGVTPLHVASQGGHAAVVQLLISHGARVDEKERRGWTPLHLASQDDHVDTAGLLVDLGADLHAQEEENQATPLHLASQNGHSATVGLLVDRGARTEQKTNFGKAPLHLASQNGRVGAVRLLVEKGARLSERTSGGWTALHLASQDGQTETVRLLLDLAEAQGKRNEVLRARNYDDNCPLHVACQNGHVEIARVLLDRGANVNARGKHEASALLFASRHDHVDIVHLLLERRAKVALRTTLGQTAIDVAAKSRHAAVLQLLVYRELAEENLFCRFLRAALTRLKLMPRSETDLGYMGELRKTEQSLAHSLALHDSDPVEVAREYVKSSADLQLDAFDRSPIAFAIDRKNHKILKYYLQLRPAAMKRADSFTQLLLQCTLNHDEEAAHLLLDHKPDNITGQDLVRPGANNLYPLLVARMRGLSDLVQRLLGMIPRECLTNYHECFPDNPAEAGIDILPEGHYPLAVLNRHFPLFLDNANPSWKPQRRETDFAIHESIVPNVASVCHILEAKSCELDEVISSLHLGQKLKDISSQREYADLHAHQQPQDRSLKTCLMAYDLLIATYVIQEALRTDYTFRLLQPKFSVIGSIIEGTRIGPASELDVSISYDALKKDFFMLGEDSFHLALSEDGVRFFKANNLEHFVNADATLNYLAFFEALLTALEHILDHAQLPPRLRIHKKNRDYDGERCEWCIAATLDKNERQELVPLYHCDVCLPAVTFTKLGPCLIFKWQRGDDASAEKPVTTSIDLIPIFPHSASSEQLFAQLVHTLIHKRPRGWQSTLRKYLNRDRRLTELDAFNAAYISRIKGVPVRRRSGSQVAMKIQHFGQPNNFLIRSGQTLDASFLKNETVRSVYIALKGVKAMLDIDVKSYFIKKTLMKQQIQEFVEKSKPNELELFYEVLTQPELRPLYEGKVNLAYIKDAVANLSLSSININRDVKYGFFS